jgi:hypothetical protein
VSRTTAPPRGGSSPKREALTTWGIMVLGAVCVLVAFFVIIYAIGAIWAYAYKMYYSNALWNQDVWLIFIRREMFPGGFNPLRSTGWPWLIATLVMALVALVVRHEHRKTAKAVAWLAIFATVASLGMSVFAFSQNGKNLAQNVNEHTQFVVEDAQNVKNLPGQLRLLTQGASKVNDKNDPCLYHGKHDVPSCIIEGVMPSNWTPRVTSEESAQIRLAKSSTGSSNTKVRLDTLTYLYTHKGGVWSAVRDGKNKQPLDAVVYWDGKSDPTSCRFNGTYAIDKSFGGTRDQNLRNAIAAKYSHLFYNLNDIWGFCNGDEPIVVVPMMEQHYIDNRTYATMGGAVVIRGDHGKTSMRLIKDPKSGDNLSKDQLPGPTYPMGLAEQGRDLNIWAAGRANLDRGKFGFETTDEVGAMGDNVSEFMLQDQGSKKLYWVTPLRPHGSDSEQFVAYSITPADEGHAGRLNTTRVYVLPNNDPRVVNIPSMTARVKRALLDAPSANSFFAGGGKIVEFLPVDANHWQAYGEMGNQVDFLFEIPTDRTKDVTVIELDTNGIPVDEGSEVPTDNKDKQQLCKKKVSDLTGEQLRVCISQSVAEKDKEKADSKP